MDEVILVNQTQVLLSQNLFRGLPWLSYVKKNKTNLQLKGMYVLLKHYHLKQIMSSWELNSEFESLVWKKELSLGSDEIGAKDN